MVSSCVSQLQAVSPLYRPLKAAGLGSARLSNLGRQSPCLCGFGRHALHYEMLDRLSSNQLSFEGHGQSHDLILMT